VVMRQSPYTAVEKIKKTTVATNQYHREELL
jgi:hypothetical protein